MANVYTPPPAHRDTASRGTLWDMHYLDDLRHDPWGTAMQHAFALCDALAFQDEGHAIPASLDYRPSPLLHLTGDTDDYPDQHYRESLWAGLLTVEQAEHALRVLERYLDVVRRAGRDY